MAKKKIVEIKAKGAAFAPLDDFIWFQGELKVLSDARYEKLRSLILDLGFSAPIQVWFDKNDKMQILDGHQRIATLKQMREEGFTIPHLPYNIIEAADEAEARLKVLSLDSRFGELTDEGLRGFIEQDGLTIAQIDEKFALPDLDLPALATEPSDPPPATTVTVSAHERTIGVTDEDAEASKIIVQNESKVRRGHLWILGEHRLLCGDSTDVADLDRLTKGERAQMMFTDPPYGVDYQGGHFHSGDVNIKRKREKLANDDTPDIYSRFLPLVPKYVDGPCYTWYASTKPLELYTAVEIIGEIHALIIWHKTNATYAAMNAQYKQRHEPCLYWKPKGSNLRWIGPTDEHTVWEMKRDARNDLHPTQKPVALAERALVNHDAKTVLDLFAGSGSTLIAAENQGRSCWAMELSEHYCGVIIERWERATGKKAILEMP